MNNYGQAPALEVAPQLRNLNNFVLHELPGLNNQIASDERMPVDSLVRAVTPVLAATNLEGLPGDMAAKQGTTLLTYIGDSVASGKQRQGLVSKAEDSFNDLRIGPGQTPFLETFSRLRGNPNDPQRSTLRDLTTNNTPGVSFRYEDERGVLAHDVRGAFGDGWWRLYLGEDWERAFMQLLVDEEAVQVAVNEKIDIIRGELLENGRPVDDQLIIDNLHLATVGLHAAANLMRAYGKKPNSDAGKLPISKFVHQLRQFAATWRSVPLIGPDGRPQDDVPQSGALDTDYLRRDLELGLDMTAFAEADFPECSADWAKYRALSQMSYHNFIQRLYPAFFEADKTALDASAAHEQVLHRALGARLGVDLSKSLDETVARQLIEQHPSVALMSLLLEANYAVSAVHLPLANANLYNANSEVKDTGSEYDIIDADHGTTGMPKSFLEFLLAGRWNQLRQTLGKYASRAEIAKALPGFVLPPGFKDLDTESMMTRYDLAA